MGKEFFNETSCPLCDCNKVEITFPIDLKYAESLSGVNLDGLVIGVATCTGCSHQFIQPVPTAEFLQKFYFSYMSSAKHSFYLERNSNYIPISFRDHYGPWLDEICDQLRQSRPVLLDVGCGLGMFLRLARDKGFKVFGIEPNAEAVDRMAIDHSLVAYNTLLEDYSESETFDVVTMWDLFEHLSQPKDAIKKVHSILNPRGLIVLEIPIRDSLLHWLAKLLYKLSFGAISRPLLLICGIHHLQYFSKASIISFIEEHGFKVLAAERRETNLSALKKKENGVIPVLYNISLMVLFFFARLIHKENKLIVVARKR